MAPFMAPLSTRKSRTVALNSPWPCRGSRLLDTDNLTKRNYMTLQFTDLFLELFLRKQFYCKVLKDFWKEFRKAVLLSEGPHHGTVCHRVCRRVTDKDGFKVGYGDTCAYLGQTTFELHAVSIPTSNSYSQLICSLEAPRTPCLLVSWWSISQWLTSFWLSNLVFDRVIPPTLPSCKCSQILSRLSTVLT